MHNCSIFVGMNWFETIIMMTKKELLFCSHLSMSYKKIFTSIGGIQSNSKPIHVECLSVRYLFKIKLMLVLQGYLILGLGILHNLRN